MSCPEETRHKNRQDALRKIWSSKDWKEKKRVFLEANPVCAMCGKPSTVPHHPYKESVKGHYDDLTLSQCVAYCNKCHFAVHKGLKLCGKCNQHYHRWDALMCRVCFDEEHPEIVQAREEYVARKEAADKELKAMRKEKARAAKQRHPCKYHRLGGACGKSMLGSRCAFSPTKAEMKCGDFVAKGGSK